MFYIICLFGFTIKYSISLFSHGFCFYSSSIKYSSIFLEVIPKYCGPVYHWCSTEDFQSLITFLLISFIPFLAMPTSFPISAHTFCSIGYSSLLIDSHSNTFMFVLYKNHDNICLFTVISYKFSLPQ